MMSIWKFPIAITDEQKIEMPIGSKTLSVQTQNGVLCIWAIVDTDAKIESRSVGVVGTGNHCWCFKWDFIGTVADGPFMWHVFIEESGA